jgi:hypothetical protein
MNKSGMEAEGKQRESENLRRNADWHACQNVPNGN